MHHNTLSRLRVLIARTISRLTFFTSLNTYSDGDLFSSQIDTVVVLIGEPHPHRIDFVSRNRIEN